MKMFAQLATLAAAAVISSASGAVVVGAGGALPDATSGNSIPNSGFFSSSAASSFVGDITGIKSVTLSNLSHTWVGDMQITLISPNGTRVNLFSRFGVTTATGVGSSKDLGGTYTFVESGGLAWNPIAGAGLYPGGIYDRSTNTNALTVQVGTVSGVQGLNPNTFASMIGGASNGNWTIEYRDFAGGDIGTLGGWSVDFNFIPTPGALALLGVAGLAGRRRRA